MEHLALEWQQYDGDYRSTLAFTRVYTRPSSDISAVPRHYPRRPPHSLSTAQLDHH